MPVRETGLPGLLQCDGGRKGRHASRIVVRRRAPYRQGIRGHGAAGRTRHRRSFGTLREAFWPLVAGVWDLPKGARCDQAGAQWRFFRSGWVAFLCSCLGMKADCRSFRSASLRSG